MDRRTDGPTDSHIDMHQKRYQVNMNYNEFYLTKYKEKKNLYKKLKILRKWGKRNVLYRTTKTQKKILKNTYVADRY